MNQIRQRKSNYYIGITKKNIVSNIKITALYFFKILL
jgi:hypothetical protein